MNRIEFARVREVFHEVVEQPDAAGRDAALDRLCAGEEGLGREVRALLVAHEKAGAFLEDTVVPSEPSPVQTLSPGTRVGAFDVEALVGEGGMGRVYRARDTRLDRTVALKILGHAISATGLAQGWLRHEARVLSQLNHPHICTLYDIVDAAADGRHSSCLVMEYLDGETLEARLGRATLSIDEVGAVAEAMASALDAAHAAGVVHGDLKPGNVMLLRRGGTKLLDFGLARLSHERPPESGDNWPGPVLAGGTPAYMAPEQARGGAIDARSDLFAFGRVLTRMLDALRPADASDARVETFRWSARRCEPEDPNERWQSARDLLAVLQFSATRTRPDDQAPPRTSRFAWASAMLLMALAGTYVAARWSSDRRPLPVTRVSLTLPEGVNELGGVRLSPDGRRVLFAGRMASGGTTVFLHDLSKPEAQRAGRCFDRPQQGMTWSPDGREVLSSTLSAVVTCDVESGVIRQVVETPLMPATSWSANGVVLMDSGSTSGPLFRVAARGGPLRAETRVDTDGGEIGHAFPVMLPDGEHYLFVAYHRKPELAGLYLGKLGSPIRSRLTDVTTPAAYTAGHVAWVRRNELIAQPLDVAAGQLTGRPISLALGPQLMALDRFLLFSVNRTGDFALAVNPVKLHRFVWRDRAGRWLQDVGEPGVYEGFSLNRDASRLVVSRRSPNVDDWGLWLIDLRRNLTSPWAVGPDRLMDPRWAPDGTRVAASNTRSSSGPQRQSIVLVGADGKHEPILDSGADRFVAPDDWTPDGRGLVYHVDWRGELRLMPLRAGALPTVLVRADQNPAPARAAVSPDGRFIAYQQVTRGRVDVWLDTFPKPSARLQVSRGGGVQPRWRADSSELFFLAHDGSLQALSIATGPVATPGVTTMLFATGFQPHGVLQQFAPAPDGARFLMLEPIPTAERPRIDLVLNGSSLLKQ